MTWHYQSVVHDMDPEMLYCAIHELYTAQDGIESITFNPINLIGDSPEDILEQLELIKSDILKHGVRNYNEF